MGTKLNDDYFSRKLLLKVSAEDVCSDLLTIIQMKLTPKSFKNLDCMSFLQFNDCTSH